MGKIEDTRGADLSAYQQYIAAMVRERGFDDETVSQKFMLLLEECGEFAKAARKQANLAQSVDAQTEELDDAAADVLAILFDICNRLNLNLEDAFIKREHKNQGRVWE